MIPITSLTSQCEGKSSVGSVNASSEDIDDGTEFHGIEFRERGIDVHV